MLGSDSYTPAAGSLGMLAIGVGDLEVALAISGRHRIGHPPERVRCRRSRTLVSPSSESLSLVRGCRTRSLVLRAVDGDTVGIVNDNRGRRNDDIGEETRTFVRRGDL